MKIIGKVSIRLLLCLFALSLTTETTCSAALPAIAKHFNIKGGIAQTLSSIYFLGFALGIFSLGRVSDVFGRRPVVLAGIILYIISSIISIFVDNIEALMVMRFLQAFGASVGSVIAQAMARDSYQGHRLSYVYSSLAMGLAFLPSLGSLAGGYIVEYFGWRYVFVFLSSSSLLILLVCLKYLPETNGYIGSARNNKYLRILKIVVMDKIVLLYALIIGSFNGIMFGFYLEAPFIFINKLGISPSIYGKLAIMLSLANLTGSIINRKLNKIYVDTKKIMISGLILSLLGCTILVISSFLFMEHYHQKLLVPIIFIPMIMQMIGHSLLIPMILRYALEDYSRVSGTAGSIFGSLYYSIVAIISFIISTLHGETITNFTLLFFFLSMISSISFYLIQKWQPIKKKYEFN